MSPRIKKLIGLVILLVFLGCYVILAAGLAPTVLKGRSSLFELFYYAIAGLIWVLPAGLIITWMQRPAKSRNPSND